MPAHKHAELMALYAADAAETETPWKRWEVLQFVKGHRKPQWQPLELTPRFHPDMEYRRIGKNSLDRYEKWWAEYHGHGYHIGWDIGWEAWQAAEKQAKGGE